MIIFRRITAVQLLDVQVALALRIEHCLEHADSEPSERARVMWAIEAGKFIGAYRVISRRGWRGRNSRRRSDDWARRLSAILASQEIKRTVPESGAVILGRWREVTEHGKHAKEHGQTEDAERSAGQEDRAD